MMRKNEEFPKILRDAYKNLPRKMRVRVKMTARELLEIQRDNNALINTGESSLDGKRGMGNEGY
jgi:PHP family Zn ribbon phosphoesterase